MGRASIKKDRTIYQTLRENMGWSRERASEITLISESRIEKIEFEKTKALPDDVVSMSKHYNAPELCNYYCVHECAIGEELKIAEIHGKGLAQIVLEILTALNLLEKEKDRLIEIAADEQVSEDELQDFLNIQNQLEEISNTVESLKLWMTDAISKGQINKDFIDSIMNK